MDDGLEKMTDKDLNAAVGREVTRDSLLFRYTHGLGNAVRVLDAMRRQGFAYGAWDVPGMSSLRPRAAFRRGVIPPDRYRPDGEQHSAGADTLPRAICIAALRAVRAMQAKPSPAPTNVEEAT